MTHILITRPQEASLQLAKQLRPFGFHPIIMPLYTFSPHDPGLTIQQALAGPKARYLAIFTSPRAVQFGLEHIPPKHLHQLEFAAIGSATRANLEQRGLKVQLQSSSGYTSEDLLQVPELATNPGSAIIFCAPGGRKKLPKGLQGLGWTVNMAMVYQRQPLPPTQGQVDEITEAENLISIWTSISALDLARHYLPAAAWSKILHAPALVISARIKHYLQQAGATQVELTEGPGNRELLRSIKVEFSKNG
jgi:uroporphyrinogen-III synthase